MGLEPQPSCFSLRRVNPFQGVMAVVKGAGGRALSTDGRHWRIQVLAHPPRGLWSRGGEQEGLRYFHFGIWSEREGVTQVPLNPILDSSVMLEESERLIEQLGTATVDLPFPLAKEFEQWLLDVHGAPLALIGTALTEADLTELAVSEWTASGRDDERPFISATLSDQGLPVGDAQGRCFHVEAVERLIAQSAGSRPMTQWFSPDMDDWVGLAPGAPSQLVGRRLPREDFPPLTLRTDWSHASDRSLIDDYIAWLAPYLLSLPDLSEQTRRALELQASRHALLVDSLWPLYPSILDVDIIKRARVEARLRRSGA